MVQENPAPGAIVGRTIGFLLGDQFARLKVGDRFFFDLQNQAGSFNLGTYLVPTYIYYHYYWPKSSGLLDV